MSKICLCRRVPDRSDERTSRPPSPSFAPKPHMQAEPIAVAGPAVRLTEYSHGAGCGCKIAPAVLTRILAGVPQPVGLVLLATPMPGTDQTDPISDAVRGLERRWVSRRPGLFRADHQAPDLLRKQHEWRGRSGSVFLAKYEGTYHCVS